MANNFYNRLTRLFKSGPAIRRRVKGYDAKSFYSNQMIKGNYGYRAAAPFGFGRENSPFSVLGSYGILDRMARYCLAGETKIATPSEKGYETIKDMAFKHQNGEEQYVFSYDPETKTVISTKVKNCLKTKKDFVYEVSIDSGTKIKCTKDHLWMLRDGTFKQAQHLKPHDSLMPFNRKEFGNGYRNIYTFTDSWRPEHVLVAEMANKQKIKKDSGLHVHHKNFKKTDNHPNNLQVMNAVDHLRYHLNLNKKIWDNEQHRNKMSALMKKRWTEDGDLRKNFLLNEYKRKQTKGYKKTIKHIVNYNKTVKPGKFNKNRKDQKTFDNANCKKQITFQKICSVYKEGMTLKSIANYFSCDILTIRKRLSWEGFNTWNDFVDNYCNHKVVSVKKLNECIDVYDIEVDHPTAHNFGISSTGNLNDFVFVHNSEFGEMEYTPEISKTLDIYADEIVGGDEKGKAFHIYSDNQKIKKSLEELFYDTLNVEFNIRPWARNVVKYGDFFLLIEVLPDIGLINAVPIPVNEIEREEGFDPEDPYAVRFKWLTRGNTYLENWQIAHFRILGNDLFLPYGTSILESSRRIWRQLIMLEDAMLTYRVVRSPERRVFYIDVGNMAPNDVPNYMEAAKAALNSRGVSDREHGRENLRFNSPTILDDYYIPVRAGQTNTRVETLSGGQHVTATEDIEYIQRKLFAALGVPKPYLNFDENLCLSPDTQIPLLIKGDLKNRQPKIEEIANSNKYQDLIKQGKLWVYSTTLDGKIVPGKIKNCWKTKEVKSYIRVTLDNGETIDCTENHPFLLRNGEYVRADELKPNNSLMPLYRKISNKKTGGDKLHDYEMIKDNKSNKWIYTHQMVANDNIIETDASTIEENKFVIHHKDFDKTNNNPNNLVRMGFKAHGRLHAKYAKENLLTEESRQKVKVLRSTREFWEKHQKGIEKSWADKELAAKRKKAIIKANKKYNKIALMQKKLKEIQTEKIPTYEELLFFVKTNKIYRIRDVKENFGCSYIQLRNLLKDNGFKNWNEFYQNVFGESIQSKTSRQKQKNKKLLNNKTPNDFVSLAIQSKSIERFCVAADLNRQTFYRFLNEHNVDHKEWFEENLNRNNHSVVSVETILLEQPMPVYDLEVEKYHNFAVAAGCFVHNSAKASLAQMDIRFSRTISTFQKIMLSELNKLAIIHLYSIGFDGPDLVDFEIKLSNPSSVALQQKLELWSAKFDVGGTARETGLVDDAWIQKNILEFTKDEIEIIKKGRFLDKIKEMEIELAEPTPVDPNQKPKTTDPFDPSNYDSPAPDVPKDSNKEDRQGIDMSKFRKYDDKGNAYVVDLAPEKSPIKATPFLTKHRRNRVRRVGQGGRHNTMMPDFKSMVSAKNKYTKDVHGQYTEIFNKKDSYDKKEKQPDDFMIDYQPKLTNEIKSIINKLKKKLPKMDVKNKIISEVLDSDDLSSIDKVDMFIEQAFGKKEQENDHDEIESIDEKTLSEVFNDEN